MARELAHDQATALASPDDQDLACALGRAKAPQTAFDDKVDHYSVAEQDGQREQEEQRDHPSRERHGAGLKVVPVDELRLYGMKQRNRTDDQHRRDDHALD